MTDLESFLDNRWEKLQQLCAALAQCTSKEAGSAQLVNQLVPLLGGARFAGCNQPFGLPKLEAVSGVTTFDPRSKSSITLVEFAAQAMGTRKPVARQQKPALAAQGADGESVLEDGAFANL